MFSVDVNRGCESYHYLLWTSTQLQWNQSGAQLSFAHKANELGVRDTLWHTQAYAKAKLYKPCHLSQKSQVKLLYNNMHKKNNWQSYY